MAEGEAKRRVPVKEGLFRPPTHGEEGHLIGTRCRACGEYFHPRRITCANCFSEDVQEVPLSRRGRIFTYTVARVGYPMSPVKAPFVSAYVELPEGVQVISHVTDLDPDRVEIGTEVELYFWKVLDDQEGNEWMAYAFRPVEMA